MKEKIDIKEVKISKQDAQMFKKQSRYEQMLTGTIENLIENQTERHQKLWKTTMERYKELDPEKPHYYNPKKHSIVEYKEEPDVHDRISDLAMSLLLKNMNKKGFDVSVFGIDMVK